MKRLYRSERDSKIAGVCGGLGDYFNIDPTLIRALFLASILFGGFGIVLYIALWIVASREGVVKKGFPGGEGGPT